MSERDKNIQPRVLMQTPTSFNMLPQQTVVDPASAQSYRSGRTLPTLATAAYTAPNEIVELARALSNDLNVTVDNIFQYVHDNVDFIPCYGLQKGGWGALIDGTGTALDQADLMVQLLLKAGYSASDVTYECGTISLTSSQWSNWLGTTDINLAAQILANGGIGCAINTPSTGDLALEHCWVQVNVMGTNYAFDPAFKQYNYTTGINVGSALGYNFSSFQTDALVSSGSGTGYIKNVNSTNVNGDLKTYSMNLYNWIMANMPNASFDQILGGRTIVPTTGLVRNTTLPYAYAYSGYTQNSYTPVASTSIPPSHGLPETYKATMEVVLLNLDIAYRSADVYGKRMTLWFNSSGQLTLYLDGTAVSGPSTVAGTWTGLNINVTHPYASNFADSSSATPQSYINIGASTTIGTAWGVTSGSMGALHQIAQNQAIADGVTSTAENMLGQSLLLICDNLMGMESGGIDILSRLASCTTVLHHVISAVGHRNGSSGRYKVVNSFSAGFSVSALNSSANAPAVGYTTGLLFHALEGAAHQQVTGVLSADTVGVIATANNSGTSKIYLANSGNWLTVGPLLTSAGYSTDETNDMYACVNAGGQVLAPDDTTVSIGTATNLSSYIKIQADAASMAGQIFGAKGAVGTAQQNEADTNSAAQDNARQADGFGVPAATAGESSKVNFWTGQFEHSSTDITVGNQGAPYALSFTRSYNSNLRLTFQGLGFGWTHNWLMSATANSDGFAAFGAQQVMAAVAAIASLYVVNDIASQTGTMPVANAVATCLTMQWLSTKVVNNVVWLQSGGSFSEFVLLPDGTYLPPLGMSRQSQLTLSSGLYTLTTADQVQLNFRTSGRIDNITYPFGIITKFNYSGSDVRLNSVAAMKGTYAFRQLSFSYDSFGQLATVIDGNGRTVTMNINATTGNLDSVSDPLSNSTSYSYASRGLMTQAFKPANPTVAVVTNTYDSLNRVKSQTDAYGNTWSFFLAGTRSEELAPDGNMRMFYFDPFGGIVQAINALGQTVTTVYDGIERPILVTQPEGNSVAMTYDDIAVLPHGVGQTGTGNVATITQNPKPRSGLSARTTSYVYPVKPGSGIWWSSKPIAVFDAANNETDMTYDSTTGLLTQVKQAAVGGIQPLTNYTYNSIGQCILVEDPTGNYTRNTYDTSGSTPTCNLLSTIVDSTTDNPSGFNILTSLTHDAVGNVATTTDPNLNVTSAAYDSKRQVTQVTGPQYTDPYGNTMAHQVTNITYDANGNVTQTESLVSTDANSQVTTTTYTVDDKVSTVNGPVNFGDGSVPIPVVYQYDNMRRVLSVTDPTGHVGSTTYDQISRPLSCTVDGVTQQTTAYTNNGKVANVTDANSNETQYTYDGFDRATTVTYPDSSTETASYDALNNVTAATTRASLNYSFVYDALNRLTSKTPSGQPTVSFTYDLAGRLSTVATPTVTGDPSTGTFTFRYDSAGRMWQEEYPDGKTVGSTASSGKPTGFDANGNLLSLQYADGTVITSAFDTLNRVTSISGFGASTAFSYDTASRRMSQLNGNNTAQGYKYDQADNLLAMTIGGLQPSATLGTPSRIDFTYGLTAAGQNGSKNCNTSALLWQPSLMSTTTYGATNNLNQYPSVDSVSLTYDSNGNLTYDGTNTYVYDYKNRLVSVTNTGGTVVFTYDPFGRMTLKTVGTSINRYVYRGMQRIEEYDYVSGNLLTSYVYGTRLDECLFAVDATTGDVTYLHADETGSTILCTDSTATPNAVNAYDPYGQLPSGSLSTIAIGYTGQFFHSEAGIYFYKARHYSPTLGRFLQPDPIGYGSGLNMYEYAGSDPINNSDPMGLDYRGFIYAGSGSTTTLLLLGRGIDGVLNGAGAFFAGVGTIVSTILGSLMGGNHVSAAKINTQNEYAAVAQSWAAHQQAYEASTSYSSLNAAPAHANFFQLSISAVASYTSAGASTVLKGVSDFLAPPAYAEPTGFINTALAGIAKGAIRDIVKGKLQSQNVKGLDAKANQLADDAWATMTNQDVDAFKILRGQPDKIAVIRSNKELLNRFTGLLNRLPSRDGEIAALILSSLK